MGRLKMPKKHLTSYVNASLPKKMVKKYQISSMETALNSLKKMPRNVPSKVNSSRLTKIRMGSDMNFEVISRISWGNVAEMRFTWVDGGRYL